MTDFEKIKSDPWSRRAFLARMGAAGLGVAAVSLLGGCAGGSSRDGGVGSGGFPLRGIPGRNDNERVLNFALTLELLETDLYRQALNIASGRPIQQPFDASPNSYSRAVSGGNLDGFGTDAGFEYLLQFAFVEKAHVEFLQMALASMGAPVVAANPGGYRFPSAPEATIEGLLRGILPLEETGVRAYLGAAPFLRSLPLTQTAVSIYSTEARHSSALRVILDLDPGPVFMSGDQRVVEPYPSENTFEYFLTPQQVSTAIGPFMA